MTGFNLAAGLLGIFFAAGIAVGLLAVIAAPWLGRRPPAPRDDDKPPRWRGR